jgi:hypothetical protein
MLKDLTISFFSTKRIFFLFLLVSASLSFLFFRLCLTKANISLSLQTESRTHLKIYWAKGGDLWSEQSMCEIVLMPGFHHYSVRIPSIAKIDRLRLDTSDERISVVTIKNITILQNGYPTVSIGGENPSSFGQLTPIRGIAGIQNGENGLVVTPEDNDPQLRFLLPKLTYTPEYALNSLRILIIFLFSALLIRGTRTLWQQEAYVPYLLIIIGILILVMASTTKYNLHPDEYVHVPAAQYYTSHTLPPEVGSQETWSTYSIHGFSRLNSGEIAYLFAGKFLKIMEPLNLPSYFLLRLFNVLLFFILLLLAVNSHTYRILLIPVLITPQAWYIYSYFNSDAFAFFLTFIAAHQLVSPQSLFNKVIQERIHRKNILNLFLVASLFALLLLTKLNFYFFLVFAFMYLVLKLFLKEAPVSSRKDAFLRLFALGFCGILICGALNVGDMYVNGINKDEKVEMYREKLAQPMFKPSTPLDKKYPFLQLKERGVPIDALLTDSKYNWGWKTFASAFGVYGYMTVLETEAYYDSILVIGAALLLVIVSGSLFRGGITGTALAGATVCGALLLIGASLYNSWVSDFQAQGRFLLPILPMFSVLIYQNRKYLFQTLFPLLVICMFCFSIYSFLFVGIPGLIGS